MKQLVVDESLSEETRACAQKALDELVSARIEKDAALQQQETERNATLKELQSEAKFAMTEWLQRNRLLHHGDSVTRVTGL